MNDNNSDKAHYVRLFYNEESLSGDSNIFSFKSCPKCKKSYLHVTDFATKGNESFFHLVSEQLTIQPQSIFDKKQLESTPNGGRKVLLFSDSRQTAATLAKELTSVADEEALKKAINVAAKELIIWAKQENIEPTMNLLYVFFLKVSYEHNLRFFFGDDEIKLREHMEILKKEFETRQKLGDKVNYERLSTTKFKTVPELYSKYLLKHLCSNFRSFTDLGLCWIEPSEMDIKDIYSECIAESITITLEDLRKLFSAWANEILTDSYAYDPSIRYEVRKNITRILRLGIEKNSKFKKDIKKILIDERYDERQIEFISKQFVDTFTIEGSGDSNNYRFLNPDCIILQCNAEKEWYKCPKCGRVFPITLWNKCALCGDGKPKVMKKHEFDGLAFWRDPIIESVIGDKSSLMTRINAEEHTAQLSHKDQVYKTYSTTEEYEMRFQNVYIENTGPVDILSCTTTMEVGIDIGSLTAVGLRNIPPMRENYQQRAGRAGRRGSAISTIVTYVDNGPHDNYYFNNPSLIISGDPSTPRIDINNEKLIFRHLNVIYLTDYLLNRGTDVNELGIIDFMDKNYNHFIEYFKTYDINKKTLSNLVPEQMLCLVDKLRNDFINNLENLSIKVSRFRCNYYNSNSDDKQIQKSLLDVLLEEGIFPTYSFPRNVVGFSIEDRNGKKIIQEPDRPLDIAISEYAPGRVIVVDKKTYKSGGIYNYHSKFNKNEMKHPARPYFNSKDYFRYIFYCRNKSCNWVGYKRLKGEICPFCGNNSIKEQNLLKPWGFAPINGKNINDAEADVEMSYAETPSFSTQISNDIMIEYSKFKALRFATLSNQQLFIVNQGPMGEGFTICEDCGAAVPGNKNVFEKNKINQPFVHPYTQEKCIHPKDKIINTFLGHRFLTDMILFEIKLDDRSIDTGSNSLWMKNAAITLSEALALGASKVLDIDFKDLRNGYRIREKDGSKYIDIYLFDCLSSGAGYSSMLQDHIEELFESTKDILNCKSGCETACHNCLKHYSNQWVQDDLDRKAAQQLLIWCKFKVLPDELLFDEQVKLVSGLKEYMLNDEYIDIKITNGKIFLEVNGKLKEICVYPYMWNKHSKLSKNVLAISDKLLSRALPNAYAIINDYIRKVNQ